LSRPIVVSISGVVVIQRLKECLPALTGRQLIEGMPER
jgi:hypothetical protein